MITSLQYKNGLLIIIKTNKLNDFVWIPLQKTTIGLNKNSVINSIKPVFSFLKQWFYIDGFGFRTQFVRGKIIFKIGFSHLIYVKLPEMTAIGRFIKLTPSKRGLSKKKLIYIIGFNFIIFQQFIWLLSKLRAPNSYREKGIYLKTAILKFKKTKKKTKGKF